jgi:hypothetical protein
MSSGASNALGFSGVEQSYVIGWRNRTFFELVVGYGLILMVIWSPEPFRIALYFVTLGWIGYATGRSFSGWDVMGVKIGGLANSLWVVGAAVCLAGSAVFVAKQGQTLHSPRSLMRFTQSFWGYVLWSFFQQFLLQDFVLRRLLKLTSDRRVAVIGAAGLFALAHLPNSMLTVMTLVWGVVACLIFLRYRNLFTLGVVHAILGISVAITVPAAVQHDMRVGLGYLKYRPHLQHRHNPVDRKLLATVSVKVPLEREFWLYSQL